MSFRGLLRSIGLALGCLAGLWFFDGALRHHPRGAAALGIAVAVAGCAILCQTIPGRQLSLGACYLGLFALFHSGLFPYLAVGKVPELFAAGDWSWYTSPQIADAIVDVIYGTVALVVGYSILNSAILAFRHVRPAAPGVPHSSRAGGGVAGTDLLGFAAVVIGVLTWFAVCVTTTGLGFVGSSYLTFLADTRGSALPMAYLLMGLGMGALGRSSKRLHATGLLAFGVFALPAFVIGLRGEVLIPAAAQLILAARSTPIRLRFRLAPILLGLLALGSIVRQIRQYGLSGSGISTVSMNPLDGVAEMGGSLRTLVIVRTWHDAFREPFAGWGVYWAPIQRLVVGRLLGLPVSDTVTDPRAFSATMLDRAGAYGGSPVAESFYASGVTAVILVMATIGAVVAVMDRIPTGTRMEPLVGTIGFVLLLWVRNDFTPVVAEVGACVALVIAGNLWDYLIRKNSPKAALPTRERALLWQ